MKSKQAMDAIMPSKMFLSLADLSGSVGDIGAWLDQQIDSQTFGLKRLHRRRKQGGTPAKYSIWPSNQASRRRMEKAVPPKAHQGAAPKKHLHAPLPGSRSENLTGVARREMTCKIL